MKSFLSLIRGLRDAALDWWDGQYEGAQRSRDRSFRRGQVQDARFDANQYARHELVRVVRGFQRNNPIANRLSELWVQFTIGPYGLRFVPATSSPEFNLEATTAWDRWSQFCSIDSFQNFGAVQSLVSYSWFWDGECFIILTRGRPPDQRPRLQLIECHRVETPPSYAAQEGATIYDGIEVDLYGRPVAYHVRDTFSGESFRRIPADFVVHVFEPERPGQLRGLPLLTSSLVDLHDLDDLQKLAMRAAKTMASVGRVFKKRNSELSRDQITKTRLTTTGSTSTGAATTEQRVRFIQEQLGGESIALYPDEELEQPKIERPGPGEQFHWDYMTSKVCAGSGIPKLLAFPHSMQGTVARADLEVANSFFRARTCGVLIPAFTKVRDYWLRAELRTNPKLNDPLPPDWWKANVRPPRTITADVGRNSQAMISELRAGVRDWEGIYGEGGDDWEEQFRKRARQIKRAQEIAAEEDIDVRLMSDVFGDAEPEAEPESPVTPSRQEIAKAA